MKLFLYSVKHEQVISKQELGKLTEREIELVNKILYFLNDNLITDGKYKSLTLAEDIDTIYDDEDNEPQLVIRGVK